MEETAVGNASSEVGRKIYSYLRTVIKEVMGVKLVAEHTTFNAAECGEIKRRLIDGPLNCYFTDGNVGKIMSVSDLFLIFRVQPPIPEDLPQYR